MDVTRIDSRIRTGVTVTIAVALFAAALWLAEANVAAPLRHKPVAPKKPVATPVFVPRIDLKVRLVPIPTPIFAKYRSLPLYLPVKPKSITVIAFHQAGSHPVALCLTSLVTIARPSQLATRAVSTPTTGPDESAEIASAEEQQGAPEIYEGRVLRLWRTGRSGDPNTAVDVGAKPGTPIYAPVSGTVSAVHKYKLYGQYDDYEIHILPKGWAVDCCILHTEDPKVKVGDAVVGGVTQVATVRWLSRWFDSQLDDFTHDGGNHVHVQIDQLAPDGKSQLMGGLESEFGLPKAPRPKAAPTPAAPQPTD